MVTMVGKYLLQMHAAADLTYILAANNRLCALPYAFIPQQKVVMCSTSNL
jgi:hypothetical protein